MRKLWIGSGLVIALVVVAIVLSAAPAAANNGAFVLNKPDGVGCIIFTGSGIYLGPGVFVANNGGNVLFQCNASLIAGPGVSSANNIRGVPGPVGTTCKIVETPGGIANATCH